MTIGAIAPSARYSADDHVAAVVLAGAAAGSRLCRRGLRRPVASGRRRRARPGSAAGPSWRPVSSTRAAAKRPGAETTQRHPGRALEEAHLVPEAALPLHVAVVAGEDHDGVVELAGLAQHLDQPADLVVDVGDRAVVGAAARARTWSSVISTSSIAHTRRSRALVRVRDRRVVTVLRHRDVVVAVAVPPLLGDRVRVVRMGERDDEAERPLVAGPDVLEQRALGGERRPRRRSRAGWSGCTVRPRSPTTCRGTSAGGRRGGSQSGVQP